MNEGDQAKEDRIRARINAITDRLQKIANLEATQPGLAA